MSRYFDRYRIKRAHEHHELMNRLQIRNGGIFDGYPKILMISAIVGYVNGAYVEIDKQAEPVQLSFFSERDRDIIDLIAYAHTKEQSIVEKEDKYSIFESYANGGFPILLRKLGVSPDTTFDAKTKERVLKTYYSLLVRPNGFKV